MKTTRTNHGAEVPMPELAEEHLMFSGYSWRGHAHWNPLSRRYEPCESLYIQCPLIVAKTGGTP